MFCFMVVIYLDFYFEYMQVLKCLRPGDQATSDRQTETDTERDRERETNTETDTHRETQRETQRERER